jgi:hypothetical protein
VYPVIIPKEYLGFAANGGAVCENELALIKINAETIKNIFRSISPPLLVFVFDNLIFSLIHYSINFYTMKMRLKNAFFAYIQKLHGKFYEVMEKINFTLLRFAD